MIPLSSRPGTLTGKVVCPDDAEYSASCAGFNLLYTNRPAAIVFAKETTDVVNALTWAREHDVPVRARSGRHCLEGWSTVDDGLVIDVSHLKSAVIDAGRRTATVGAGQECPDGGGAAASQAPPCLSRGRGRRAVRSRR